MRIRSFQWIAQTESHPRGAGKGGSCPSPRGPQRAAHATAAAIADPDSTPLKATDQDSGNSIRDCGTAVALAGGGWGEWCEPSWTGGVRTRALNPFPQAGPYDFT